MDRPLTPKQQRFAAEYPKDYQAKQAAIRAGYSEACAANMAMKLMRDDRVIAEIGKHSKAIVQAREITPDLITNGLATIALDENESTRDRIRAYELLGKHLKLFTDKVESTNVNLNHEMTEEEAEQILKDAGIKV